MEIKFQGRKIETSAATVEAFLQERGIDPSKSVVELDGEILPGGLAAKLEEGSDLNVYRICAGG